jgi:hypothetical protein
MRNWRLLAPLLLAACGTSDEPAGGGPLDGKHDSSVEATFLDFSFDGELVTDAFFDPEQTIRDQLLYTIGHLNENRSVGRLDRLKLSNIQESEASGKKKLTYHAELPVAWGERDRVPATYELVLPRDASFAGLEAFTAKYKDTCVDHAAHDVTSGSMWYYYRPEAAGCRIEDADVVRLTATHRPSPTQTSGKYPEYHKVWEDGVLRVVAIFGKFEDGATSGDAGIDAYNSFVRTTRSRLARLGLRTTPENVPETPGVATPDVSFQATLADGRKVEIVALMVDNVRTGGPAFQDRYEALSTKADLIAYNGHAGLGQNVRALARMGQWEAGQYVIVFMNGCDTFAYVDGSLADARAQVNPDDPEGTKYMEFVTNAMPAFFHDMSQSSWALIGGLMDHARPATYETIFESIASDQVVVVTGDEDNVYRPGFDPNGPRSFLDKAGAVAHEELVVFETAVLEPGKYHVNLAGDPAAPIGDADLYVKLGAAPTLQAWDCRPLLDASEEHCTVEVTAPSKIFAGVHGFSRGSTRFLLTVLEE